MKESTKLKIDLKWEQARRIPYGKLHAHIHYIENHPARSFVVIPELFNMYSRKEEDNNPDADATQIGMQAAVKLRALLDEVVTIWRS